ncbi:MAG: flagellar biosynthetic protein FliO [Desulfobacula sp.]|uniref:flagellar biosynthetic protein FliO n=1 Tax=Desulfobacula sp. TaxID=2593537 RepID=UPI0025B979A8|nr:flagellar biosynthetic protein FliO [Desulfobacula sp.]MCD4720239.1 flagellar biosynthetic protein FliO [Desulfobacula sp.]
MNTSSEIWFAFARTFCVLFLVLASIILVFYLIKRFSTAKGVKGGKDFIKVLTVHHLSPKEKLVLLDVLGDTILIGVTSTNISKISSFETDMDFSSEANETSFKFSDFLTQKLGSSFKNKGTDLLEKGGR